jgi:hypothetical protein
MIQVGDRIKVIDQEIYGEVLRLHPTEVVIADEDAETWDNELCFKLKEVEEIKESFLYKKDWGMNDD